ncbi:hypothetical protein [Cellulomonas fengjieae]|uniref:Uncharacterized protein n=1 Tax=Cellulomonas fengjieae TaxID=2819978 RepID=A0ABS3SH88_9CELL|nr:hypothetical protein [Cellulomonas fengjieae]MBO3085113.1 hypothetical protein [Cellulomonas fengjieae]QVI66307.1 hypothetical protein KG102_01405 [Cellulomonas fengjieae]
MSDTGRPGPDRPAVPPISSWQAPQRTTPTGAADGAEGDQPGTEQTASSGRPAWLVPVAIGAAVLVIAAIVIAIVLGSNGDGDDAEPAAGSTVQLPSPTPTVAPAARPATTAFAAALPPTVLQYALATSVPDTDWQAAGALEAYTETYTDGASGTVTVRSGQWETPEEAAAFAATLVAALPAAPTPDPSASPTGPALPQTGEVTAAGAAAGTYSIADAGDGTGLAVWTNGTTVFQATAPLADVVDLYNAFPL